jgi:hypothetical protein
MCKSETARLEGRRELRRKLIKAQLLLRWGKVIYSYLLANFGVKKRS